MQSDIIRSLVREMKEAHAAALVRLCKIDSANDSEYRAWARHFGSLMSRMLEVAGKMEANNNG